MLNYYADGQRVPNQGNTQGINNPQYRQEFRQADKNGDGVLTYDEVQTRQPVVDPEKPLSPKTTPVGARDDPLDSNVWSVVGLLLAAIFFFLLGIELNDSTPNYHLSREFGYVAAVGFCIYLIGMMFSAGGDWCSTPVEERGCGYFAKLFVICGAVGLATVMWGLALGFTMNMSTGGERNLVESCAYILGISCFFIAIGRVLNGRSCMCTQIIAWFAFTIMLIIGIFFIIFGHFYGEGEDEKGIYSAMFHIIGALLLIYMIVLIVDMIQIRV